jgi:hypothetical protein
VLLNAMPVPVETGTAGMGGEKWLDSEPTLNVDPTGGADECVKKEASKVGHDSACL